MDRSGIDALSERQKQILRLVWQHLSSKDIARELGISPNTVDQHVRFAIRLLGAKDRFDAARQLNVTDNVTPQSLGIIPQNLADHADSDSFSSSVERRERQGIYEMGEAQQPYLVAAGPAHLWRLPLPERGRERNDLSSTQRMAWFLILGLIWTMLAIGSVLGLAALSRLIN
ncbi:helix-turn-helix domain-containing protein [Sphingomonas crocodyli]|uniref:LuxR family transcriptional regulator n=1 Tax=Sphingomonas crocodyli TaxID=1979270 RepID=A0A437LZN3_9SPHN|nr:helix-turn-helix transcriptional regulator [Sphingomonas crocodyli]RVT90862.1 LuxR family transcriptional regulator [Sphingomonas crocodyli]